MLDIKYHVTPVPQRPRSIGFFVKILRKKFLSPFFALTRIMHIPEEIHNNINCTETFFRN